MRHAWLLALKALELGLLCKEMNIEKKIDTWSRCTFEPFMPINALKDCLCGGPNRIVLRHIPILCSEFVLSSFFPIYAIEKKNLKAVWIFCSEHAVAPDDSAMHSPLLGAQVRTLVRAHLPV